MATTKQRAIELLRASGSSEEELKRVWGEVEEAQVSISTLVNTLINTGVNGALAMPIKFDAEKVKPFIQDKPNGWDDEDNAPFELEFFEFLQGQDLLDLFIHRVKQQNKGEFKLQYDAWLYVQHAFTWSRLESPMWTDVSNTWYLKLTNLKQTK